MTLTPAVGVKDTFDDAAAMFVGWSGGGCAGTGTCTVTMNADETVTATFDTEPFAGPGAIAEDGTHVWVANTNDSTVAELSASTGELVAIVGGPHSTRYPRAISSDGKDVWVAGYNNRVTEMSATDGAVIRVISGRRYKLFHPVAICSDGKHVWVANSSSTLTELSASTGALLKVIPGSRWSIACDDKHVWVAMSAGVDEFSAATGKLVKVLTGPKYAFGSGSGVVASDGKHVWVGAGEGRAGFLTEVSASTGAQVRVTKLGRDFFPQEIAADGKHVWITRFDVAGVSDTDSVTELSARTGRRIRVIHGPSYKFDSKGQSKLASDGTYVWVTNLGNNTVTELSASTGALVQVLGWPGDCCSG